MNISTALDKLVTLTGVIATVSDNASRISALIALAQKEGRDTLTADEWAGIDYADNQARAALVDAIAQTG